jgi:adenine-specific DNA-methyltransferase
MRDRLLLSRELLTPCGSIFVQISDENLHHVRELMDEVFGAENFVCVVTFKKTSGASGNLLPSVSDYLLWYCKSRDSLKYRQLLIQKVAGEEGGSQYTWAQLADGSRRNFGSYQALADAAPTGSRVFRQSTLTSQRPAQGGDVTSFEFEGRAFSPGKGTFKTNIKGLNNLAKAGRLIAVGSTLSYVRFLDDFPVFPITNLWDDTVTSGFAAEKTYVVQTNSRIMERCILMTTDPGDLVLDPTCGSGTTAYVAELWGRRWITIDTSRVPLALARQRLLTATYDWYALKDDARGPIGGFVYKRKQNNKGEEVGGIVPHVTLKSIANDEPPQEEVLVDRPEKVSGIVRISGPFAVEATIPTPVDWEGDGHGDSGAGESESHGSFVERMIEVLRRSPVLHVGGGKTVTLKNVRIPAKTLTLSAEAQVDAMAEGQRPVAIVFGPENGAVSEKLVYEAGKETHAKNYSHLYVIGFAVQPNARKLVETCDKVIGVPATYVQATPDLMMGDLLKNMRSSQIFSVCGLPDVDLKQAGDAMPGKELRYVVTLKGLDVFDPSTMETLPLKGEQVPAWFLDTDYNGLCFRVCQAFFPRTSAWEGLKKALKATYSETVWDHLAGTKSAPFEGGEQGQIAVKVIDDRGNELMVVKKLAEARR